MDLVMLGSISVGTEGKRVAAPSISGLSQGIRANRGSFLLRVPLCGSALFYISVDHHPRLLQLLKYLGYFAKSAA